MLINLKIAEKIQICLKLDNNIGHFTLWSVLLAAKYVAQQNRKGFILLPW
jgi:hypothetical protein